MSMCLSHLERVQQHTGRIHPTIGTPYVTQVSSAAVGQLSTLSSRTKWQRLSAGNTPRTVSPAGNCCHFVLLDNDESCPV